ncbi:hypothetical protein CH063_12459 [Colletotrichum higginsianum]|uniref:Uncharacterized protein n=1 Tax=Colletotrichum higginsianum (strain IMI 349063) TaxID=759273 RepID=H1VQG5_COLHI|nr:hypothetical protein CH063_12459 [Colletotrichum higginsianum]
MSTKVAATSATSASDFESCSLKSKGDARAAQGGVLGARDGHEVGRVGVGEELGDDGGLGDDLAVVRDGRHQAARVDAEVLGRARHREVDDLLLERQAELGEGDVGAVSP